jgi:hypothetical protein
VAAVFIVDIGALNPVLGESLGVLERGPHGVPIIWIARQRLGVEHKLSTRVAGVGGGGDRGLHPIGRAGLALADAFTEYAFVYHEDGGSLGS